MNAVVWRVKTGAQWRDLPELFGNWETVYNRFHRWARTGRWGPFSRSSDSRWMKSGRWLMHRLSERTRMRRAGKRAPKHCSGAFSRRFFNEGSRHHCDER
ncbi:transposase [Myxococcus stipitatus]|uniref:transposase n=1 Tax=Myxococcus stipitatus TaxID=83455 RepID=UPI003B839D12